MQEDMRMGAETIPVKFGPQGSARIILSSLIIAFLISVALFWLTPARLSALYFVAAIPAGIFLLLLPAWRLYTGRTAGLASSLFNRASYYPVAMFIVIFFSTVL
jgi:4-hydroxybenzoate polyprenyltransferase